MAGRSLYRSGMHRRANREEGSRRDTMALMLQLDRVLNNPTAPAVVRVYCPADPTCYLGMLLRVLREARNLEGLALCVPRLIAESTIGTIDPRTAVMEAMASNTALHASLRSLHMPCRCQATGHDYDAHAEQLVPLLHRLHHLTAFSMPLINISKANKQAFAAWLTSAAARHGLHYLGLQGSEFGADFSTVGKALRHHMTITHLRLSSCGLHVGHVPAIVDLIRENTTLTQLDLSFNELSDDYIAEISQALAENTALVEIDLSACAYHARGLRSIFAALRQNKVLRRLNVDNCVPVGLDVLDDLCAILEKHNTTLLQIQGPELVRDIDSDSEYNQRASACLRRNASHYTSLTSLKVACASALLAAGAVDLMALYTQHHIPYEIGALFETVNDITQQSTDSRVWSF